MSQAKENDPPSGLLPSKNAIAARRALQGITLDVALRVKRYAVCGTGLGTIVASTK